MMVVWPPMTVLMWPMNTSHWYSLIQSSLQSKSTFPSNPLKSFPQSSTSSPKHHPSTKTQGQLSRMIYSPCTRVNRYSAISSPSTSERKNGTSPPWTPEECILLYDQPWSRIVSWCHLFLMPSGGLLISRLILSSVRPSRTLIFCLWLILSKASMELRLPSGWMRLPMLLSGGLRTTIVVGIMIPMHRRILDST